MAPASSGQMLVQGHLQLREDGLLFILDERLTGHDTFLSTTLRLKAPLPADGIRVRILSFDDVTVLSPLDDPGLEGKAGQQWSGTLLLPHGCRPPAIPEDLARAAAKAGIDTAAWSEPEARQLLTYLGEARSGPVRTERVRAIIVALARQT